MDTIFKAIEKSLPSGSGFSCGYEFSVTTNSKIKCHSYYHCLHERGYYDGYVGFTITIDLIAGDFKLSFDSDQTNRNRAEKYQLREYMTDTIYNSLSKGDVIS